MRNLFKVMQLEQYSDLSPGCSSNSVARSLGIRTPGDFVCANCLALRCNGEGRRARGSSSRRCNRYLSRHCSRRHGCSDLCIRVDGECRCRHGSKFHKRSLRKTHTCNDDRRPHRPRGRTETGDRRRNLKLQGRKQIACGLLDCYLRSRGTCDWLGGQESIASNRVGRCRGAEGDSGSCCKSLTEQTNRSSHLGSAEHQRRHKRFQVVGEAEDYAVSSFRPSMERLSVDSAVGVKEKVGIGSVARGGLEIVEILKSGSGRADAEECALPGCATS